MNGRSALAEKTTKRSPQLAWWQQPRRWLLGGSVVLPVLALWGVNHLRQSQPNAAELQAIQDSERALERLLSVNPAGTAPAANSQPAAAPSTPARSPADTSQARPDPRSAPSLAIPSSNQPAPALLIRVAIAREGSQASVGSQTESYLTREDGQILGTLPAGRSANVVASAGRLQLASWASGGPLWLQPSQGGAVLVNGQPYRGKLKLIAEGDRLIAVNYVDLEQYLVSVVGAEMPASWPIEALKAQAVAARSYAIAHMARPASAYFDLGSTTRWQAYNGINSEATRSAQAVQQTAGLLLSYRGGIVESLYAATYEIVAEAHGHLGASMSQHGARDLAEQGFDFTRILGNYYRGAQLARLSL
ncbi:SpoIID/LytB domain-containing protein [Synechococcus elongatus]|uniref:SpoIID/LytB domain-containing protein n=1 Tax=Synechococcus elongatus TaxID=32046 RepID=UPI000F7DD51F|nr:SpoIID/LytB domain-containing protein [Synechococcus elongatus]